MKRYLFIAFFMLLVNISSAKAEEIVIGEGNTTLTDSYMPFYGTYHCNWTEVLFTQDELLRYGMTAGTINSLALQLKVNATSGRTNFGKVEIYLANTDLSVFSSSKTMLENAQYTLVHQQNSYEIPYSLPNNSWLRFDFHTPFAYEGKNLLVYICQLDNKWSSRSIQFTASTTAFSGSHYFHKYYDCSNNTSYCGTSQGYGSRINRRVDMKFDIDMSDIKLECSQSTSGIITAGAKKFAVLNIKATSKASSTLIKDLSFDAKMTSSSNVHRAYCLYSEIDDIYTADFYGSPSGLPISNNMTFSQDLNIRTECYFWLVYDVSENATRGAMVDACMLSANTVLDGIPERVQQRSIRNYDPGEIFIVFLPLTKSVYTVGIDGDYASLGDFAFDFSYVGATRDLEVQIISSTFETGPVVFKKGPLGNFKVYMHPVSNAPVVISSNFKEDANERVKGFVQFSYCDNFVIDGSLGISDNDRSLTFISPSRSTIGTFYFENSNNCTVRNTILKGGSLDSLAENSSMILKNSNDFNCTNNSFSNAYEGITVIGSENLAIRNNDIGDANKGITTSSGLRLLEVKNAVIECNRFTNLYSFGNTTEGISLTGNGGESNIKIINNTFNSLSNSNRDESSGKGVYGIVFSDILGVDILHNTFYVYDITSGHKFSALLYDKGRSGEITLRNNILHNELNAGDLNTVFLTEDFRYNPLINVDGNIYFATSGFHIDMRTGTLQTFDEWKQFISGSGQEIHSSWYDKSDSTTKMCFHLLSRTDPHLDGIALVEREFLVPFDPMVPRDMDGEERGATGITNAGADHIHMVIYEVDKEYPYDLSEDGTLGPVSSLSFCEDGESEIYLRMEKEFQSWGDNVQRTYVPIVENTWVRIPYDNNTAYDTLNFNVDFHVVAPSIYSNNLSYTHSGIYRVYSRLGQFNYVSKDINVDITRTISITEQPSQDILACSNAGLIEVPIQLIGSYTGLQWERRLSDGSWQSVPGENDLILQLYTESDIDLDRIKGDYRLRINTKGICDTDPVVYSDIFTVSEGYPLTFVDIKSNYEAESLKSLCEGDEIKLYVEVEGSATGYIWQKYNEILDEFVDISDVVNPTAVENEYRIVSAVESDGGFYRCLVIGPQLCTTGYEMYSSELELVVKPTARILQQPKEQIVCFGNKKVELEAAVSGEVTYQWYKDGIKLEGATDAKLSFYNEISSEEVDTTIGGIDTVVTVYDTTGVLFEDAGLYKLEISYTDCSGNPSIMFTDEVQVYVYGPTEVYKSTELVYGFKGGYAVLEVEVKTLGSDLSPEKYQWYRNYSLGYSEKVVNSSRIKGATSSRLVFNSLEDSDLNDGNNPEDYYYCEVIGVCNSLITNPAYMRVVPAIVIYEHPYSAEKCEGDAVDFEVSAHATEPGEPISYQWYKDGVALSDNASITGSQTSKLSISSVGLDDIGKYSVNVSYVNLSSGILSTEANLLVESAPIIETQPTGVSIDIATTTDFTLTVVHKEQYPGYICNYQWYKDGVAITGATDSYLLVDPASIDDTGIYHVVLSSLRDCGETKSVEVKVEVTDSGIEDSKDVSGLTILSILPNPTTHKSILRYNLDKSGLVTISVLDISGRLVSELSSKSGYQGLNEVSLDMSNLSNGTYYILVESNGKFAMKSIVVSK